MSLAIYRHALPFWETSVKFTSIIFVRLSACARLPSSIVSNYNVDKENDRSAAVSVNDQFISRRSVSSS